METQDVLDFLSQTVDVKATPCCQVRASRVARCAARRARIHHTGVPSNPDTHIPDGLVNIWHTNNIKTTPSCAQVTRVILCLMVRLFLTYTDASKLPTHSKQAEGHRVNLIAMRKLCENNDKCHQSLRFSCADVQGPLPLWLKSSNTCLLAWSSNNFSLRMGSVVRPIFLLCVAFTALRSLGARVQVDLEETDHRADIAAGPSLLSRARPQGRAH